MKSMHWTLSCMQEITHDIVLMSQAIQPMLPHLRHTGHPVAENSRMIPKIDCAYIHHITQLINCCEAALVA